MSHHVLAADIGATYMRAALVDLDSGELLARARVPTRPYEGLEAAAQRLGDLLEHIVEHAGAPPTALGISTAGPLDPRTGTYQHPTNLPGWHGRSMRDALSVRLRVPVEVGHDATLAALAETRFGAHRGTRDLVYLTVSTGIGAGIVAQGRAVTGAHGGAGEAGHMIVRPGGHPCGGGCEGCLEGEASGSALAAIASERFGRSMTTRELFALAEEDPVAEAIVRDALRYLGAGIASLLAVLDPEVVVLGGGVARGLSKHWWGELMGEASRFALRRYGGQPPVTLTALDDDACILGAAVWASDPTVR